MLGACRNADLEITGTFKKTGTEEDSLSKGVIERVWTVRKGGSEALRHSKETNASPFQNEFS